MKQQPRRSCATCADLIICEFVTEEGIKSTQYCDVWKRAPENEVKARVEVQQELGPWALRYAVPHLAPGAKTKPRKRRRNV